MAADGAASVASGFAALPPMTSVLTLICDPARPALDDSTLADALSALRGADAVPGEPDWLAPGVACDLPFAAPAPIRAGRAARAALRGRPVDLAVQPADGRRKRLLVADMDATIVTGETLDELAAEAGIKDRIAPITARAMRGELDFEAALRERVALLAGLDGAALDRTWAGIRLSPGAASLVRTMRAGGARTVLVSGGFRFFADRVAALTGFDRVQANTLEITDGRLTGRVVEPILGRDAKREVLLEEAERLRFAVTETMAVGDGANDLAMLAAAGLGVAYRGKPKVAARARVRIDHGDLTALLYLQGYRREAFVD
jgi:phosphoserine phosphatase